MPKKNISDVWLRRLKSADKRIDYFDQKVTGLILRLNKNGTKTFAVVYRLKGDSRQRRATIGRYPAISLAKARKEATRIILNAERGIDERAIQQELLDAVTFAELSAIYIDKHLPNKAPSSQKEDIRKIEKVLNPVWGDRKARDIKRRDVIHLLDSIATAAPIQTNRTLALIRKIYNFGISRDLVENNPCTMVKAPAKEKPRDRVLDAVEIRLLWPAFESTLTPEMSAIMKIRLLTAQRGVEVGSMRWCDLDLDTGWWTIPAEVAKNNNAHRVPLTTLTIELIEQQRERAGDSEWVFSSKQNKSGHIQWFQKSFNRAAGKAGLQNVKPHDLRRTATSIMAAAKVPRLVLSKVLNHTEKGVTGIYDRYSYDAEKRAALEKLASRLQVIIDGSQDQAGGRVVNLR